MENKIKVKVSRLPTTGKQHIFKAHKRLVLSDMRRETHNSSICGQVSIKYEYGVPVLLADIKAEKINITILCSHCKKQFLDERYDLQDIIKIK